MTLKPFHVQALILIKLAGDKVHKEEFLKKELISRRTMAELIDSGQVTEFNSAGKTWVGVLGFNPTISFLDNVVNSLVRFDINLK